MGLTVGTNAFFAHDRQFDFDGVLAVVILILMGTIGVSSLMLAPAVVMRNKKRKHGLMPLH